MDKLINSEELNHFFLLKPEKSLQKPIILTSAHSGTKYTQNLINKVRNNPKNYHSMEDMYINDIISGFINSGFSIIMSTISRVVIDLNRSVKEIDSTFITNGPENIEFKTTDKVRSGIGLIPLKNSSGKEIYSKKLDWAEVEQRIEDYYLPWHSALNKEIIRLLNNFGRVFIIDIHSMPSASYQKYEVADFVIGNDFDNSSTNSSKIVLSEIISSFGYNFSFNDPYSGGHITKHYASLDKNIQCIQLEIKKNLYMNEKNFNKKDNFRKFSADLKKIIEEFTSAIDYKEKNAIAAE
tara:strand:- start:2244 stop:3128 length:885 start_codon:yes stop_codon:yes gene_type:complete